MRFKKEFDDLWQDISSREKEALDPVSRQYLWARIQQRIHQRQRRRRWAGISVGIMVVGLCLGLWWRSQNPLTMVKAVSSSQVKVLQTVKMLKLKDGSQIWLEPGSRLEIASGFGTLHRRIYFSGRAKFDIAKQKNLPFELQTTDFSVRVLGTIFTIEATASRREVRVKEGKVQVTAQNKIQILPAYFVWTSDNEKIASVYMEPEGITSFNYSGVPLSQVLEDLQMKYSVRIKCPARFLETRVQGAFQGNLEQILRVVAFPLGLEVKKNSAREYILQP